MKVYSAFSLNMLSLDIEEFVITTTKVTPEWVASEYVELSIGHEDTSNLVADMLGVERVGAVRDTVTLNGEEVEHFIVAQYSGPRLSEGATVLPAGASIQFFFVMVEERQSYLSRFK